MRAKAQKGRKRGVLLNLTDLAHDTSSWKNALFTYNSC